MNEFLTNQRAQGAIGKIQFVASLIVGAVLVWILNAITKPLFEQAKESGSGETATQGTAWLQEGVNFVPILFLFIAFFGLVAYSVYSREVVR